MARRVAADVDAGPVDVLLERDRELATLQEALAGARRDSGRLVLVRGEAGIGKTTLVGHFCGSARGARVLSGACDPLTTPRPLGPLLDILARLDRAVGDDVPPRQLFNAFLEELTAPVAPTIAVIEDAHWADEGTLDLIRFLGRRLHDTRSVVVVTYRSDELGPSHPLTAIAGDLASARATTTIDLLPLTYDAVRRLAASARRSEPIAAEVLYRLTAGNPFFASEVLAHRHAPVPATVRDAVLARAARLAPAPRAVLDAAAVVPTRAETWLLQRLVDASAEDLDACVTSGMLGPDEPGTVAFRHELARQAIAGALPPARSASLHAAVANLLIERHGEQVDAARVAHHAEQAGDGDLARTHAIRAARRAAELGAHREAAAQFERALRHADPLAPDELAELLQAYADEVGTIDRVDLALEAEERALALWRRVGDRVRLGDAMRRRAMALWSVGHSEEAGATVHAAIETLEQCDPGPELANAYAFASSHAMLSRDHAATLHWGRRAIDLAQQFDAVWALPRTLNSVGSSRILNGDPGGQDDLRRSIALGEQHGLQGFVAVGWSNLGSGTGEIREYAVARDALERAVAVAIEHDLDLNRHYATAWLARVHFEQGEWARTEELLETLPADEATVSPITRIVAATVLGRLGARRGDADPWPLLDTAWRLAEETGDLQRLWPVAAARAEAAWLGGDEHAVAALVEPVVDLARACNHPWAIGELALWQWRAGAIDTAPPPAAAPYAAQIAGRVEEAMAAWQELGCPYEVADSALDGEDVGHLRRALDILDGLGAAVPGAVVRRRLRELGARGIPRGPRPATAAHPAGLTHRQAEVLRLVSQGLSDAEIAERLHLSPKTVGHHVSAVLLKLGVSSRGEAAHAAHARGLLADGGSDG